MILLDDTKQSEVRKLLDEIALFASNRNTWILTQGEKDNLTHSIINRVETLKELHDERKINR